MRKLETRIGSGTNQGNLSEVTEWCEFNRSSEIGVATSSFRFVENGPDGERRQHLGIRLRAVAIGGFRITSHANPPLSIAGRSNSER